MADFFLVAAPSQIWLDPVDRWLGERVHDQEFSDAIRDAVQRIGSTLVGRAIFRALKRPHTIITPGGNLKIDGYPPGSPAGVAETVPHSGLGAGAPAAPAARPLPGYPLVPQLPQPPPNVLAGTGAGSPATIYLHLKLCRVHFYGVDGVLVHELSHAIRSVWGAARMFPELTLPLSKAYAYRNSEEFFSVAVNNMYLVELGRQPIVGYDPRAPGVLYRQRLNLPGAQRRAAVENKVRLTEQRYMRGLIARAWGMRGVINDLASLQVPYNPFRDVDRPDATTYLPQNH